MSKLFYQSKKFLAFVVGLGTSATFSVMNNETASIISGIIAAIYILAQVIYDVVVDKKAVELEANTNVTLSTNKTITDYITSLFSNADFMNFVKIILGGNHCSECEGEVKQVNKVSVQPEISDLLKNVAGGLFENNYRLTKDQFENALSNIEEVLNGKLNNSKQ